MYLLVCNAGSTSLKFKLFDMPAETVLAEAKVERIGRRDNGIFTYKTPQGGKVHREKVDIPTYTEGIKMYLDCMLSADPALRALDDIRKIERDAKVPTVETIKRDLAPLDVSLSEFFYEDEEQVFVTPDEKHLIDVYRLLPEDKAKALIEFIDSFCK